MELNTDQTNEAYFSELGRKTRGCNSKVNRECVYCYGASQAGNFSNILSSSSLVDELTDLSILLLILAFFGILRPLSADKKASSSSQQ